MSRDDQFAVFAKKLSQEILVEIDWIMQSEGDIERIIARRAYDLVQHTIHNTAAIDLARLSNEEHVARIPDMRQWPEETIK